MKNVHFSAVFMKYLLSIFVPQTISTDTGQRAQTFMQIHPNKQNIQEIQRVFCLV